MFCLYPSARKSPSHSACSQPDSRARASSSPRLALEPHARRLLQQFARLFGRQPGQRTGARPLQSGRPFPRLDRARPPLDLAQRRVNKLFQRQGGQGMRSGRRAIPNDVQDDAGKRRIALVPVRLPVAANPVNFHVALCAPVPGRIAAPPRENQGRPPGSKSRDGAPATAGRRGFANARAAAADAARCFATTVPGDGRRRAPPEKGAPHFAPASGRRNWSRFPARHRFK